MAQEYSVYKCLFRLLTPAVLSLGYSTLRSIFVCCNFIDLLFLDLLIETAHTVDHAAWPQVLVCCLGALKFISDNSTVVKTVASKFNLTCFAHILTGVSKAVCKYSLFLLIAIIITQLLFISVH